MIGKSKAAATHIHIFHVCAHRRFLYRYFRFGAAGVAIGQVLFLYSIMHSSGSSSSSYSYGVGLVPDIFHRQSSVSCASEQRRNLRKRNHAIRDPLSESDTSDFASVHKDRKQGQAPIFQKFSTTDAQQAQDVPLKTLSFVEKRPPIELSSFPYHASHHRENILPTSHEYYSKHKGAIKLHPDRESEIRAKKENVLTEKENYNPVHDVSNERKMAHYMPSTLRDPLLEPVVRAGEMYSIGRKDRSGSVVSDMLYAHAFAFAHNVTYLGACFTVKGLPKEDTRHLLQALQWTDILPFSCPPGVDASLNLAKPNATELSPLMLSDDVYRFKLKESYFTPAWRESIQKSLRKEHRENQGTPLEENQPYEIAVHVRRGDVSPCKHIRRYLHNKHYLTLIDQFTPSPEERGNRTVHVTIYSESVSFEPFDVFRERGYTVELDTEDLAVVWKALATADLAILSRSYFSFVPAAVNPNTVVATEFFEFEPLPGWKRVDKDLVKQTDQEIYRMKDESCPNIGNTLLKK